MRSRGLALAATASITLATLGVTAAATAGAATSRPEAAAALVARPAGVRTPTKAATKPVGYVYASTLQSKIQILAVEANHTLKVIGSVTTKAPRVFGLAILHTPGGVHLYAIEASTFVGTLYEYSVNTKTGKLTPDNTTPVQDVVATQAGSGGLLAYDGYATNKNDKSTLFSEACTTTACNGQTGFVQFSINPQTGAPKMIGGLPPEADIYDASLNGKDGDVLLAAPQGGAKIAPFEVKPTTGGLVGGTDFYLTYGSSQTPTSADTVTETSGRVAVGPMLIGPGEPGVSVYPSTGTHIDPGEGTDVAKNEYQITAMKFLPHLLLAAETSSPSYGPQLEYFSPDGAGSDGTLDLTQAPYDLPGGSNQDSDFPTTIFTLGKGVYIGTYSGRVIQATDGVNGKGLVVSKTHPTVSGTAQAYSLTGFLLPHKIKTSMTIHVHLAGGNAHVSGKVSGGKAGITVTIILERRTGGKFHAVHTAKAKLSNKHAYASALKRANNGTCRAVASYPGTSKTASSSASKTFAC